MDDRSKHSAKLERPIFILLVAALGFFLLSFVAMGLGPWTTLKRVINPPEGLQNPYYDENGAINSVGRGRQIYINEGCWHCHSQFVRPIAGEPFRYGPKSQNWESMFDVPQTFGTRRIGPDLSREAGRRTDDWHIAHLYDPRSVVPLSIMPSYSWYFSTDNGTVRPNQEALDLVAYLQYLGSYYADTVSAMVNPPRIKISGDVTTDDLAAEERGQEIFKDQCTGCHGEKADGKGAANAFLQPTAVDLTNRYIPVKEAYAIIYSGVRKTAMPSFFEMPDKDLWALSKYVSKLGKSTLEALSKLKNDKIMVKNGETLYGQYCLSCHGHEGVPDPALAASLDPPPREFRSRVFSEEALIDVLSNGRLGTSMTSFPNLDLEAQKSLAAYLTTLYQD